MLSNATAVLTVLLFSVAPGASAGAFIARRLSLDGWGWLATSFAVTAAAMVPAYWLAELMPVSLRIAVWSWAVVLAILTVLTFKELRHVPSFGWYWPSALIVTAGGALALVSGVWLKTNVDTFYHLAAVRSLLAHNATVVTDPIYGTATTVPDPSSGLLHALLAAWCLLKGADPLFIVQGLVVVSTVMVLVAFLTLMHSMSDSKFTAPLATLLYVIGVLFADFRSMAYPGRVANALVFLGIALAFTYLREGRKEAAFGLAVCAAVVGSTHLGSAQVLLVVVFVTAAAHVLAVPRRKGIWPRALVTLLVLLAAAAPGVALASRTVITNSHMVNTEATTTPVAAVAERPDGLVEVPGGLIVETSAFSPHGTALLVATAVLGLGLGYIGWRERDGVMMAAALMAVLPVFMTLVPPATAVWATRSYYVGWRLLLALDFVPVLVIAVAFGTRTVRRTPRTMRGAAAALAALLLFTGWPYVKTVYAARPDTSVSRIGQSNESIWKTREASIITPERRQAIGWIRAVVGDGYPVVLAPADMGYELAGLAPVALVAAPDGHSPLAVEFYEGPQRRQVAEEFFGLKTPEVRRREIAARWKAQYVFFWIDSLQFNLLAQQMDADPDAFEVVVRTSSARLYRVLPGD